MAYMNQEKKAVIAKRLKEVMPKHVKYSLRVKDHSAIVMTIRESKVDLLEGIDSDDGYARVNHYWLDREFGHNPEALEILKKANDALIYDNFNDSDIQTDYHSVGHYIEIHIGCYDRPFKVTK